MAISRQPSWKEKRDRLLRSDFIGRQEQLTAFRASVTDPDAQAVIFAISGQGGVGKTTLLKRFRQIIQECNHIAAYVDEGSPTNRVDDVPEALYRLTKDFETQNPNYKFEKFKERYKTYRQKKQELEADPEAPTGIASGIGRAGAKLLLGGAKAIPGVGDAMGEFVNSDAVAEKVGDLASFTWKRLRNQDEVQLVAETLEILTPLFLEEMNRIAAKQMVVLLFDTYEITGKFLDDWLRAVLECRYGEDLTGNFRLCIAGRNPLDSNAWAELEPCIVRSPLEPFTRDEAQQFLLGKGITSEAVIEQIWRLSSGGLPLLVSMMAQNAPTQVNAVVDPCEDAVERFLKWETDATKRQIAQDGSLPRVLNQDVVARLGDGQFEWLKDCAFVIRDEGQWRYHLVVREQMLRYQWQKSRQRWIEVHIKLATYYDEMRQGLRLDPEEAAKDKLWQNFSLEGLYHQLCAAPQTSLGMAQNGFLRALKTSGAFAQAWAEVMIQVGQETGCEAQQQWGEQLRDSMVAQQEERFGEAISVMTALLKEAGIEDKLKAVAANWRGFLYKMLKQPELALKDFQTAVEIDPDDSKYWFILALTYQGQDRHEEAIAAYQRAIEHDQNASYLYYCLGIACKAQRQYEEAIAAYQHAIELDPENAYFHYGLGNVYQLQRRYEEAIAAYQHAIEFDPDDAYPHYYLGVIYQFQGRYEEAIAAYQHAIEFDPNFAYAHNELGLVYRLQRLYEEAIASHQQAIELDAEAAYPRYYLGNVYQIKGQYQEAIEAYQQAIERDPKLVYSHYYLGTIYQIQGRYEEAIEAYQQAIELDPNFAYPHHDLGLVYKAQGRYEEAIEACQQAIELDPSLARSHYYLGTIYQIQGRYEEAIEAYQQAIECDPTYIRVFANRGKTFYLMKNYEAALSDFEQIITLDPKNARYFYFLALAQLKLNYPDLAQINFQQAISLAQEQYREAPTDWQNTFNLALYQLASGNQQEMNQLYNNGLNAPLESRKRAIRDVTEFLDLFPDHQLAQEIKSLFETSIAN